MRGLGHGPANVPLLLLYRSLVMWKADDRRFIFVTGKGGVGKTTVAAALARALAGRGKRVLIVMCNAKERVPKVIVDVVPAGVLRRDAETAWRMFKNPEETGVVVVTLPEELPVTETLELVSAVRGELELPLGILAVNGVLPALFSEPERKTFRAIEIGASPVSTPEEAVVAAARRALQEELQAASLTRLLAGASVQHVVLPYLLEDAATPRAIEALSAHF